MVKIVTDSSCDLSRMCYNKQKYAAGAPGAAWKIASEKEWLHTW